MQLTKKQWAVLLYFPLLWLVWAGVELGLMPVFEQEFPPDSTVLFLIKEGLLKVLIWIVPAVLLIRKFDDEMQVRLREMFTGRFEWKLFLNENIKPEMLKLNLSSVRQTDYPFCYLEVKSAFQETTISCNFSDFSEE